ncbi:transposase [Microbacter margulisiae]|uniref:REP element-mobilizing transposase RayT n=1 Tax=Microbacter margulisiae TaxID=1350067 RepID=A0A7W5DRK2_9PORP|nr:transposase [Microbacter margulisiae]MBB3187799.1 REP element-mobilizing transposase RayT [Microbacter margulisiae]
MTYEPINHHRRSIRLKGYDYSQQGLYFITLCVQNRVCLFGEIINGQMALNTYGQIAHNEWLNTATIRKNVTLHQFVVMPNHFHAIIEINGNDDGGGRGELYSPKMHMSQMYSPQLHNNQLDSGTNNTTNRGELHTPPMDTPEQCKGESNSPKSTTEYNSDNRGESISPLRGPSGTVGAMVRGYKSAVTKQSKLLHFDGTLWQRNYWEHIIRTSDEYERIATYIENNPMNWHNDTLK